MNDTPPDVDAAFTAMFRTRSGSERVRMACEMFDDAKKLAAADIRRHDPHSSPVELRVKIFERLYFEDFSRDELARIVAWLRAE